MRKFLIAAAAFISVAGAATAASAAPDLRPIPSRLAHGVVSVRNTGDAIAPASVVTINCHKPGMEGGCTDIPPAFVAAYTNPAYPNRLVVNVPRLTPGRVYNHTLPFWGAMVWAPGTYNFDYVADAGATVAESNEANNTGTYVKNVP
jgi:hypothetical protein